MSSSNMKNPLYIALAVIGLVLVGLVARLYVSHAFGSPVGSTFNSAKVAQINLSPSNGATTTSILNTDSSDRYILSNFAACSGATTTYTAVTGAGLANWKISAATTSASAPATVSNTNFVMNDVVATGTGAAGAVGWVDVVVASSSVSTSTAFLNNAAATSFWFRWASGSYLTFISNATNTAACTVGVYYIGS